MKIGSVFVEGKVAANGEGSILYSFFWYFFKYPSSLIAAFKWFSLGEQVKWDKEANENVISSLPEVYSHYPASIINWKCLIWSGVRRGDVSFSG